MDDRIISYGHDIEAGWLLQSCAETIQDADLVNRPEKMPSDYAGRHGRTG